MTPQKTGRDDSCEERDKQKKNMIESDKKPVKKKAVLVICVLAVLLAAIGIGGYYLISSGVFLSNAQVKVSFDSTGGSEVESRLVPKGGKLPQVETPSRTGYVFAGWYYEEAPVNAYSADDVFNENTTLYAAWYQPDMDSDIEEYIKDCDSNITFAVHSGVELTEDNLSDYISFSCADGEEGKTLSVKPQDGGYLLYSKDGFTPGFTYSIRILDTKTAYFIKAGKEDVSNPAVKAYNFTVFRENVNNVVMKAKPKPLSFSDISGMEKTGEVAAGETDSEKDVGKPVYRAALIKDDGDYQIGDIISLGSGEDTGNQYYKVINVLKDHSGRYLDLITPNLEDIYSQFEFYYSGDAVYFEDAEETEETKAAEKELQTSIKESEGYDYICTAIAKGIKQSPTLRDTVASLDINSQKRFESLSVQALSDLLKNVNVNISIKKTYDIANKENGVYGSIVFSTGDIDIKLDEKIKLTLNLTLKNELTATVYGYSSVDKNWKLKINQGADLTDHCNLDFNAVIGTSSGEKKINITEEIQNLINSTGGDKTQTIVDSLNSENFFGDDLDYVEIFNKELGNKTVSIYEVLTVQFKLNFHVDIGMRVGLDLNFDSTETRRIGLCNMQELTGTSDMVRTNQRLSSRTHFTAILKGQVGIRAGFKAEVNFSFVHMNDVLNFGFSADLGVYDELSGFARFDYDSKTGITMAGGLKSETGIFLTLEFTWNLLGWEDSVTIADLKFPILTIGSLEFPSEFEKSQEAVTFNTASYNIKNSGENLLKLKYVNISGGKNGVTINVKAAPLSADYAFYLIQDQSGKGNKDDLKYVSLNKETGVVTIAGNAPDRLDFTVVVQYTKACSLFSKDLTPITKSINLTYMKYKVDDSSKKYKATFYKPDGSVLEQKEYYAGQTPVPPAEDTYRSLFGWTKYKLKSWAKPWKEEIKPIYKDTDYHFDTDLNYINITFRGYVKNEATGKYEYGGVIAVVPTLCGELPAAPAADAPLPWEFFRWDRSLTAADAEKTYYAEYKQRNDICWTSFYADGRLVGNDYPKKGTIPTAPDMSGYNNADRKFVGWWPSLYASTGAYASYYAIFWPYLDVTFEDRDGKVLSKQRVLQGETPKAPQVDEVIEGEEDYYEYRFKEWQTEDGMALSELYKNNLVFKPVYEKKYVKVTTVFNAGDHAFADGTKTKQFEGIYANNLYTQPNFLTLPQLTYKKDGYVYTVDYWQSVEKVKGSYIKLYMSKFYTYYQYNMTFTPVFKSEPIEFTVRFDGGDDTIYLRGHYGDVVTADMLDGLKKGSAISNYVYVLRDYGLALPYRFGSTLGTDGQPLEYISVVAKFELVGISKTVTFDANGGRFADNKTVKTVTGPFGTRAAFNEKPVKDSDERYDYTFAGWASDKKAERGSSFTDFVINGSQTFYAVYDRTLKAPCTITFDAGEGCFENGNKTIVQTFAVGDYIIPPDNPTRQADAVYRYVFANWQPLLTAGTKASVNCTYTAQYRAIRIDGKLEETGIIVTDGISFEDICVNKISGYTYGLAGPEAVPTLTITENGLEFSGTSSEVCVIIQNGVTDVTFNGLTLSGAYTDNAVLDTGDASSQLVIHIKGGCVIRNTANGYQAVRFERPVKLAGEPGASLSVSAKGSFGSVYCDHALNVESLELEIDALKRDGDDSYSVSPIGGDEDIGEDWLFKNSVIRLISEGGICDVMTSIRLENTAFTASGKEGAVSVDHMRVCGSSAVDITAGGANAAALGVESLIFDDFNGSFNVRSVHAVSPGAAVVVLKGISFFESGTDVGPGGYDLGGTQIASFEDEYAYPYFSFGIDKNGTLVPASAVTVTKR